MTNSLIAECTIEDIIFEHSLEPEFSYIKLKIHDLENIVYYHELLRPSYEKVKIDLSCEKGNVSIEKCFTVAIDIRTCRYKTDYQHKYYTTTIITLEMATADSKDIFKQIEDISRNKQKLKIELSK